MKDRVMSDADVKKYVATRLSGTNVPIEDVRTVRLYNGLLPHHVRDMIDERGGKPEQVEQRNGREPLYFWNGTVFIPQYSGIARERRYLDLGEAFKQTFPNRSFRSYEAEANATQTNKRYRKYAQMFADHLFKTIDMPSTVIFGSTSALAKKTGSDAIEHHREYLDYQLLKIGNKDVLNIGYVYGDQMNTIIGELTAGYQADAKRKHQKRKANFLLFGRIGALGEEYNIHDLITPTLLVQESPRFESVPFTNILAKTEKQVPNLAQSSVLNQSASLLRAAQASGVASVEMELSDLVNAVNAANLWNRNHIDVSLGFVGHVSDTPLRGKTLAEEQDDSGEQAAVQRVLEMVDKL